jgi:hypothetical protein
MAINILDIQPSTISRDLRGKYVLLYGKPKSGKTTAAVQFPKTLLCAFERGYNAIGGVKPVDITRWADFRVVIKQLEQPQAKEMYETIVIDTVSIAWELCEQFICAQNAVQKISDIPWGGGFTASKKEFESCLRKITQLGYGVVLIAHNSNRVEKKEDGSEIEIIYPSLPKRAAEVCNGIVDIIGYIGNEYVDGEVQRYLYTRETPTLFAGSRFKYLAPKIKFGYTELVTAIGKAIEKAEQLDGAVVVDKMDLSTEENLNFDEVRLEAQTLWNELIAKDEENSTRILKKVEMIFGKKMKLSEITEDQVDLFNLVVLEMREMNN